ncbi:MAG: peptidylprolyl isomerase [Candidatus Lokiarchaeota archaeon]|nr:peptidylprolyl isomerase [Candidatus Lokiarchaeota archaeon]
MTNVKIVTTKGDINFKLFDNEAPLTVSSFLFLAKKGFYDGIVFHRVIDNFMIQGGDPLGNGMGGPTAVGVNSFPFQGRDMSYPYADEFQSGKVFNKPGILAMANAGPGTNGSQFFITHVPTPHLNNKHTIFGEVTSPADQAVVDAIRKGDKIKKVEII